MPESRGCSLTARGKSGSFVFSLGNCSESPRGKTRGPREADKPREERLDDFRRPSFFFSLLFFLSRSGSLFLIFSLSSAEGDLFPSPRRIERETVTLALDLILPTSFPHPPQLYNLSRRFAGTAVAVGVKKQPRVVMITALHDKPCRYPNGDYLNLVSILNKQDYAR